MGHAGLNKFTASLCNPVCPPRAPFSRDHRKSDELKWGESSLFVTFECPPDVAMQTRN